MELVDYDFVISRFDGWVLLGGNQRASEWLAAHNLHRPHRSRRDMLALLTSALSEEGEPALRRVAPKRVSLKRIGPGQYQSRCGRMLVERAGGGPGYWRVQFAPGWKSKSRGSMPSWRARTLRIAALRVTQQLGHAERELLISSNLGSLLSRKLAGENKEALLCKEPALLLSLLPKLSLEKEYSFSLIKKTEENRWLSEGFGYA